MKTGDYSAMSRTFTAPPEVFRASIKREIASPPYLRKAVALCLRQWPGERIPIPQLSRLARELGADVVERAIEVCGEIGAELGFVEQAIAHVVTLKKLSLRSDNPKPRPPRRGKP